LRGNTFKHILLPTDDSKRSDKAAEDRIDDALDAALEVTFPASDPIAVYIPEAVTGVKDVPV
jgi:nucleotide-binding universal stress UspA family protein